MSAETGGAAGGIDEIAGEGEDAVAWKEIGVAQRLKDTKVTQKEIFEKLREKFGGAIIEFKDEKPSDAIIQIAPDKVDEICLHLRDSEEFQFDFLNCLTGLDNPDRTLSAVYNLFSFPKRHKVTLKATVAREQPDIKSVAGIWLAANWHEREAYDIIGINFVGHPDLRRILLPYDWEGYPLRKDYEVQEFYQGMKVPY
jgi:NADH-quinone oxidoreductase subunit C